MKKIVSIATLILLLIGGGWTFLKAEASDNSAPSDIAVLAPQEETPSEVDSYTTPETGNFSVGNENGTVIEFLTAPDYEKDKSYQRSEFGKPWVDTDKNGCDTRNDVLARDLINITVNSKCQVTTGTLENDIYTNHTIEFVRGEKACDKTGWNGAPVVYNGQAGGCSNAVTIDHVISLEEVWYLGGRDWTFEERVTFANDIDNLVATGANSWKNSKTPAELINAENSPITTDGVCSYVRTYLKVANKYALPITDSNFDPLINTYLECEGIN